MTESWVDIASHPSSSSINSFAANSPSRVGERVPRPLIPVRSVTEPPRSTSATGSSQDEYDESSSESDRVLSSSNEELHQDDEVSDDDDNRTALGTRPAEIFTPQPNAFSHPPSSQPSLNSYFPRVVSAPNSHIRSRPHLQRAREQNMISSYQPDHDAALRASLTTLLSCAAAVRPRRSNTNLATDKDKGPEQHQRPQQTRQSNQPTSLRLVPGSALPSQSQPPKATNTSPSQRASSRKRRSRSRSKDRDAHQSAKKHRPISAPCSSYDDYFISPTLAGWVISAGMVLALSAISFSAGFAWGREAGRAEAELGFRSFEGNGSCAQEAMRGSGSGLRRLHLVGA